MCNSTIFPVVKCNGAPDTGCVAIAKLGALDTVGDVGGDVAGDSDGSRGGRLNPVVVM